VKTRGCGSWQRIRERENELSRIHP
jgi:hypothetical protein